MVVKIPILYQFFKQPIENPTLRLGEDDISIFEIFQENEIDLSKIHINPNDKIAIKRAHQLDKPVKVTKKLEDNQLLKLHVADDFDEGYLLYYHSTFGIFEINYNGRIIYMFTYRNGVYTPIHCIY